MPPPREARPARATGQRGGRTAGPSRASGPSYGSRTPSGSSAHGGSFVVGIPAAASCHEFEKYSFSNGTVVTGHKQQLYLQAALQAISDAKLHANPHFLGTALWGFASKMAYPPQSDNTFEPGTPFVDSGEEDYLKKYTY